jgi:hypothetical protein
MGVWVFINSSKKISMFLFKKKQVIKPELPVCTPLVIQIRNKSSEEKGFVLFGSSKNLWHDYFGNDHSIEISIQGDEFTYSSLLFDLVADHIKFGMIRCMSDNSKNILQTLVYETSDILNSSKQSVELKLGKLLDAYQFQSSIIEGKMSIVINKRTSLSGKLQPSSSMTIMLFPVAAASMTNLDLDAESDRTRHLSLERLSGKNVPMTNVIQSPAWYFKMKSGWNKFKKFFKRKSK